MNPIRLATRHLSASQCSRASSRVRKRSLAVAAASRGAAGRRRPVPTPVSVPVRVPVRVIDRSARAIEIENRSADRLLLARFALAGAGMLALSLPCTLEPGDRLRVIVRGIHDPDIADAGGAMLMLRWFQPDGEELLWPIAF